MRLSSTLAAIPHVYQSNRVSLRPVAKEDLLTFFGWRGDLDALEIMVGYEGGAADDIAYEEFAGRLGATLRETITLLAVDPDGQPLGFVQAYDINTVDRWCYMLTYFASDHRAQRVGLEASLGFWDFLFRYFNLRKIYADVSESSSGWLHALPGLGLLLNEEGRLRDHALHDGRYWDVTRFAIYHDRWLEMRDFSLLLLSLGGNTEASSTGEAIGDRARAGGLAGSVSTPDAKPDRRSRSSPLRSWLGRGMPDTRISPRMELVRRYVAHEQERQLDEVVRLMTDGAVYTSPMTGTVTGRQGFAALLAFRQRMRDAAERAGVAERTITWSAPEEDADAVRVRGRKDPDQEIELVWEFDAEDRIRAFATLGSTGLLVKWVLGDEPALE